MQHTWLADWPTPVIYTVQPFIAQCWHSVSQCVRVQFTKDARRGISHITFLIFIVYIMFLINVYKRQTPAL